MSNANIGWLFYKDYFNGLDYKKLSSDSNKDKIEKKVAHIISQKFEESEIEPLGSTRFQATTSYPGLLLGSGNTHELPDVKGQAILGFHFDYTTGLPVIPGSSVKGVLRSAFKHPEFITALLNDETMDIAELEKEIFDNADIFYDARIIKADAYEHILGDDYITPHNDPMQDPIPLRFIKVLPNVTFLFEFELHSGLLSKADKEMLFRKILSHLGLGAKTNVGYGKFIEFKSAPKTEEEQRIAEEEAKARVEAERMKKEAELQAQREAKIKAQEEKEKKLKLEQKEKEEKKRAEKEAVASQGLAEVLKEKVKYKELENTLKKILEIRALQEDEKSTLEEHILTQMKDKVKKRNKFPFGVLGNDKCLGKDRANALADKLGL